MAKELILLATDIILCVKVGKDIRENLTLHLLEQILPIYRILEIYNMNYTYQRAFAVNALIHRLFVANQNLMWS